jgi:hypothetical protein
MVALLPATATIIGVVVLAQVPSWREAAGVALVVAGVALHRPANAEENAGAPASSGRHDLSPSSGRPAAVGTPQSKGTRMTRSSSPDGEPRPSRLDVVM